MALDVIEWWSRPELPVQKRIKKTRGIKNPKNLIAILKVLPVLWMIENIWAKNAKNRLQIGKEYQSSHIVEQLYNNIYPLTSSLWTFLNILKFPQHPQPTSITIPTTYISL